MAQLPSNVVTVLALRALKFIFLLVALGVLVSDTLYVPNDVFDYELEYSFDDVYAYRYVLATIVIGMLFALLQIVFTIYNFKTGIKLYGVCIFQFNFYADKVISYLLGTGAAAGFGATNEMKHILLLAEYLIEGNNSTIDTDIGFNVFDKFFNQANAAIACVFLAFITSALISILSSWALTSMEPHQEPKTLTHLDTEAQKDPKALPEPQPQHQTTIARVQD
ncbi:CASP-like protein 4D1 [Impatiens glandulifera]|uniref:CASP-like protein 4D1 n=1 Tax=Impatiens glandulifera TaxID=253017 RepID=UPI001FB12EC4|nr:CASP-like protein 4D1 [Impatiens glandulifera]